MNHFYLIHKVFEEEKDAKSFRNITGKRLNGLTGKRLNI